MVDYCNISESLTGLTGSLDVLENKAADLVADAQKGIAGNIGNVQSQMSEQLALVTTKMDALIPAIPSIVENMQTNLQSLAAGINSPEFTTNLIALQSDFSSVLDETLAALPAGFDTIQDAIVGVANGTLNACNDFPNFDKLPSGEIIKKGIAGELPAVDSTIEPVPPTPKTVVEVTPVINVSTSVPQSDDTVEALKVTIPDDAIAIDTWVPYNIQTFNIGADKQPMKIMKLVVPGVPTKNGGVIYDFHFMTLRRAILFHKKTWRKDWVTKWNKWAEEYEANEKLYKIKLNYFSGTYNKDSIRDSMEDFGLPPKWRTVLDVGSLSEKEPI